MTEDTQAVVETPKAPETAAPRRGRPPLPKKSVVIQPAIAEQIARAKAAQQMRASAPAVDVHGFVTIPQKDIINRLAKDEGGQDGEYHYTFQDRHDVEKMIDQGYEPVIDQNTGKQVFFQGDPLMRTPTTLFNQSLRENKARSDALLGSKIKADKKATGEKVRISRGGKEVFTDEGD